MVQRASYTRSSAANAAKTPVFRGWAALPTTCAEHDSLATLQLAVLLPTSPCAFVDVAVPNTDRPPVVSTMDEFGDVTGLIWSNRQKGAAETDFLLDGWLPGSPGGSNQTRLRGFRSSTQHDPIAFSFLARRARFVHGWNASVTFGAVWMAGHRWHFEPDGYGVKTNVARQLPPAQRTLDSAVVLQQPFTTAYSHIAFQTLPQLVMLLSHAEAVSGGGLGADPTILFSNGQRGRIPPYASEIICSALGIAPARLVVLDDNTLHVRRAMLLALPPGVPPNHALYGRAVLVAAHARLQPFPRVRWADRTLVLYQKRPCIGDQASAGSRCVRNEAAMLAAVRMVLKPEYELRTVEAGSKPMRWTDARDLVNRARVLFGPHGGAWGNSFFASTVEGETHLIEFQQLRGRACTPNTVHYMGHGGWPRLWEIEPKLVARAQARVPLATATKLDPASHGQTVAEHNKINLEFGADYVVPISSLVNILVLAGVAHCPSPVLQGVSDDHSSGRHVRCVEYTPHVHEYVAGRPVHERATGGVVSLSVSNRR